jgi:endonuclease-3 related protein
MYDALLGEFGQQHWWPAQTRDEVIIGAILTQNTSWRNVERAIASLRAAECLTLGAIASVPEDELADLIRPSGTFRVKARRLKAFAGWLLECHGGDLDRFFGQGLGVARSELLAVPGIGPETADAILLYAGGLPTFVIDAYTLRVLKRHFIIGEGAGYAEAQRVMTRSLLGEENSFGEFHALLVEVGKRYCRPLARCPACPLASFDHDAELSARATRRTARN